MTSKIITIAVPNESTLPEVMSSFSLEENYLMIKIGCECLTEGRKALVGLTQKEIYNKLKMESRAEIENLERRRMVQEEIWKGTEEKMREMYDRQILKLNQQIEILSRQIVEHENNAENLIRQEVEKYRLMNEEKEKRVLRITENYENFLKQTAENKSSKKLGDEGEENFILLSETFKDFSGYKLEKKSHQAHKGDFHLFFKEFNVLVDLKNYSGSVQKKELDKIEHDLTINDTIDFAWLISYDSNVSDWNRFPLMCKWVVTEMGLKCIIIVNNLNANKNPTDVLRNVWNITCEFNNMINKTKLEDEDIKKMRERDFDLIQKFKTTQKRLSELKKHMMSISQTTRDIENDILYALSSLSNEIVKNEWNKNEKIKEWLEENIEFTGNNEDKVLSSEMWNKFKKENVKTDDGEKISLEEFKNYLKLFTDSQNYFEKSRKGSIELLGYKLKDVLVEIPKLGVELTIPPPVEKKKKVVISNKKKKDEHHDDNDVELDNDIIKMYNNDDKNILEIAKLLNIPIYKIISTLVREKVIKTRSDARGYNIYIETDEYKNKLSNKKKTDKEE
jgi:hypothetical protein